jgi:hypothetical protein
MPQVRYITSQSQLGAPGVYIQENAPAVPIRGQRRRTVGLMGQCLRGPTGRGVVIDSYQRFLDVFGGRDRNTSGGTVGGHVWKALQGKRWGRMIIVRVAAAAAVKASFTFETATGGAGTQVLRVDALGVGVQGNDIYCKVTAASNGDANAFNFVYKIYGVQKVLENIKITTGFDNTNVVVGNDDATLIRLVKLADGRPNNNVASTDGADTDAFVHLGQTGITGYTAVAGTDGSIANSDYTAALTILNAYRGVHACAVVGRSNTTVKSAIAALTSVSQRVWFLTTDDETVTYSAAVTERATFNSDRLSYWHNWEYVTDPVTLEEVAEEAFLLPMSIISQTDPDVHVGDFDNSVYSKASRRVYAELDDATRDALDLGGVSFLLHDQDENGNEVIIPGNGLTCDFSVNNRDLDGRYMKDFILDALGNKLKGAQFKGNTPSNRIARAGEISSFLDNLARSDRYILRNEAGKPQFSYQNDQNVNSVDDQSAGLQKELLIAKLIPKNKQILLLATVGVDAVVSEQ